MPHLIHKGPSFTFNHDASVTYESLDTPGKEAKRKENLSHWRTVDVKGRRHDLILLEIRFTGHCPYEQALEKVKNASVA